MTRQRAANAIAQIGGADAASAVDGLVRMLSAEQAFVRDKAAVALGSIGNSARAAIPKLLDRQKKNEEPIKLFVKASADNWKSASQACEIFFARLPPEQRDLIPDKFKDGVRH